MTRERKLKEVLNVRLDEPLARELRRIAGSRGSSESDVARRLLGFGIEVERRLEAARLSDRWEWERPEPDHPFDERPGTIEIEATWRPLTDEELIEHGFHEWLPDGEEDGSDAP
jgi:hypothetical protein